MTDRPLGTDTTSIDEPAPAADAAGVGSTSSGPPPGSLGQRQLPPPTRGQDLARAIACAVLVAGCVVRPELALLVAPFVPAILALRLLRRGGELRAFVVTATSAAIVGAVLSARDDAVVAPALATAILLVPLLGWLHARAARRDPAAAGDQLEWPEPQLATGLSPTLAGWLLATVVVAALAAPAVDDPRAAAVDFLEARYATYLDECDEGGALTGQGEVCERIREQRDGAVELVDDHGIELLGVLVAAFVVGAASTAHLLVLWRARRIALPVRPRWRLRELEVHWTAAYVVAVGLGGWLAADLLDGSAGSWARAAAIAIAGIGAQLVVAQGLGFATWSLTRRRRPVWYWLGLGLVVLLTLTFVPIALFALGMLDLALHPRRRAAASDTPR